MTVEFHPNKRKNLTYLLGYLEMLTILTLPAALPHWFMFNTLLWLNPAVFYLCRSELSSWVSEIFDDAESPNMFSRVVLTGAGLCEVWR